MADACGHIPLHLTHCVDSSYNDLEPKMWQVYNKIYIHILININIYYINNWNYFIKIKYNILYNFIVK